MDDLAFKYKVTRDEILMGRDQEFPLSNQLLINLATLLVCVNKFRDLYGKPMSVSSGYRPGHYNKDAHGATDSPHLTCEAVDFHDPDRSLTDWILSNQKVLEDCGLYMESPAVTTTWVHLQTRPTHSRIFNP